MDINLRIKELREKSGYTQQNIADFLNVDQSLISKIEKGERSFTADMLNSLSSLFGVSIKSLQNDSSFTSTVCAFRASDLTAEDLKTISFINKIALNADFMTKLLGD
ncbi:MAG: helix-turn-helix domain-containing protein [Bacilli bacterium]|nr:helix-turn-helix domain-containing protein [Bacilli bacterium]